MSTAAAPASPEPTAAAPAPAEPIAVAALGALALDDPEVRARLATRYLIWDAFVGGRPRLGVQPLVLAPALHRQAVAVAETAVRLLAGRVAGFAHADPEEAARYGLHPDVTRLAAASRAAGDAAALMRVDLLLDEELRFRPCEINADCPGGHNETVALPRLAREHGHHDGVDPTVVLDALVTRLVELSRRPDGRPGVVGLSYATAYAEDLQVCALIRQSLAARRVEAHLVPPAAPHAEGGRLVVRGRPLDVLYRFFPTEYMEGQRNVGAIADAVAAGELRTLSSFAHMYAQSKLVMARAHARAAELGPADAAWLAAHLPATVDVADVPPAALTADRGGWVLKRALGRVGDEVIVGALCEDEEWAAAVDGVAALRAAGERWIAQRFVGQRRVPTPFGPRLVTLGAYVLDGSFVGYFARLTSESHVSHDALCVPVFVADEEEGAGDARGTAAGGA